MAEQVTVDIKTSTMIKAILVVLGFVFVYLLKEVLVVLFLAIVIASAVHPFVDWLEMRRIPRILSVIILYILVSLTVVVFFSLLIPTVAYELNQLAHNLPKFFEGISSALDSAQSSSRYFNIVGEIQNVLDSSSRFLQISSVSILSFIVGIFGGVLSFIAVIVISFYLSVMKQGIPGFVRSILPDSYETYVIGLWHRVEQKVGRWFQGQLLLALSVGLVVFVVLSLLHIKYALLLGVLAMAFELVPVVGPVLSAIPAIILAYAQSPSLGFWVIIFFIVLQQFESHVLAPLILGKTLGLHPVTVVIALLIGGKLAGILGVLMAVPVAVVIVEVLEDVSKHRKGLRGAA